MSLFEIEKVKQTAPSLFDQIAPIYDRLNQILSCGLHHFWRKQVAKYLPNQSDLIVLDLATGTGDQLFSLLRLRKNIRTAIGIDLSRKMLEIGEKKAKASRFAEKLTFLYGNISPIQCDQIAQCITLSFGIRNVANYRTCLLSCFSKLAPGGRLIILEFSRPSNRILRFLHAVYLKIFIEKIGRWLSKHRFAYEYLHKSIQSFVEPAQLVKVMKEVGFESVTVVPLSWGVVRLYIGDVPLKTG